MTGYLHRLVGRALQVDNPVLPRRRLSYEQLPEELPVLDLELAPPWPAPREPGAERYPRAERQPGAERKATAEQPELKRPADRTDQPPGPPPKPPSPLGVADDPAPRQTPGTGQVDWATLRPARGAVSGRTPGTDAALPRVDVTGAILRTADGTTTAPKPAEPSATDPSMGSDPAASRVVATGPGSGYRQIDSSSEAPRESAISSPLGPDIDDRSMPTTARVRAPMTQASAQPARSRPGSRAATADVTPAELPPTITVTIGQVVVRADPQPGSPRTEEHPRPTFADPPKPLSLAEYLAGSDGLR
jgi:hypothetical protein